MRQRLPRSRRITSSKEIRALITKGKRSRTVHLDVFDSTSLFAYPYPRVGVIVPKHRHNIVDRNKVKRRIREILRKEILPRLRNLDEGTDVLIRARREAYDADFAALRDELVAWMEKRWSSAH